MFHQWFQCIQLYIHTLQHYEPFSSSILVFNIRSELFNNVSFLINCKKLQKIKIFSTLSWNSSTKFKTLKLVQIVSTGTILRCNIWKLKVGKMYFDAYLLQSWSTAHVWQYILFNVSAYGQFSLDTWADNLLPIWWQPYMIMIYIIIRYWMLAWFCLFVRYRNYFPVVQFQNQAHLQNPHGTGQVIKTIRGAAVTPAIFFYRRPQMGAEGGCFATYN